MARNSYIKDFARYPVGFSRTTSGVTATVTYDTTDTFVRMSDFTNNDGTGLNQVRKYRSQFDTIPFTLTESTSDLRTVALYYVANTVNHTQPNIAPYSYSKLRGTETFYSSFVTGTEQPCAIKEKNWTCKWYDWLNPFSKCQRCHVWGGIISEIYDEPDDCWKWNYSRKCSFTIQVNGGYGSTGHFAVTLKDAAGNIESSARAVADGDTITFSGLDGSNACAGRVCKGDYRLEIEDVITGQMLAERVRVPYCGEGTYIFKYRSITQTFSVGTTYSASGSNSIWIFGSSIASPPEATIETAVFVPTDCANVTIPVTATVYANATTCICNFYYSKSNAPSTWIAEGGAITIPASTTDKILSKNINVTIDAPFIKWKIIVTNIYGTKEFISEPVHIDQRVKVTTSPTDFVYDIVTNQSSYKLTSQSCKDYSVSAIYWDIASFPTIATDLSTATTAPAGHTTDITKTYTASNNTETITNVLPYKINRVLTLIGKDNAPFDTQTWPEAFQFTDAAGDVHEGWIYYKTPFFLVLTIQVSVDGSDTFAIQANTGAAASLTTTNISGSVLSNLRFFCTAQDNTGAALSTSPATVSTSSYGTQAFPWAAPLPQTAAVALTKVSGRGTVAITTPPSAGNSWTTTVTVTDSGAKADSYEFTLTYTA